MKKKALSLIIGLMSLSLLGLIGLQAYWVRHAMAVKEEQFDRSVNDALNQVVHQLEVRELAAGMQRHLAIQAELPQPQPSIKSERIAQSQSKTGSLPVKTAQVKQPSPKPAAVNRPVQDSGQPVKGEPHNKEIVVFRSVLPEAETKYYRRNMTPSEEELWRLRHENNKRVVFVHPDSARKKIRYQQAFTETITDSIPVVIRLNEDSIIKILNAGRFTEIKSLTFPRVHDSLLFRKLMPVRNKVILRTDTLVLKKNTPKNPEIIKPEKPVTVNREVIKRKEEQVNLAMEKMVMELVTKEVPLRKRLNFTEVDSLVASALADKNIDLPYAVAIAGNRADSLLHVKQVNTRFALNQPKYQVSLFPNDLVKKPEYLMLQFPDKKEYVLGSMVTMFSASAAFTLIMMLTFGATLGFIFRQKKISEIKSDFINNMTHEFKTPIATISLATDAINSPKVLADTSRINYYTGIIQQENKRMLSQVENVLQMALLDRQDLKLNFEVVKLDELLVQAIDQLKLQIESRQGVLKFTSETAGIYVFADKLHLENVFLNLLDNAFKYSPEAPVISLISQVKKDKVYITVTDQGIGMSADVQKRVFDKFYRVPTGNLHNVKGFGLGLAYVKAMAEQHKGQVSVKSSAGKGSSFQVCLPIYKV